MMVYLTTEDVLRVHAAVLAASGGAPGVRDENALESAVAQPQSGFGNDLFYPTVESCAAAYLYFISRNHAFVDGNKRTAWLSARLFFDENGYSASDEPHVVERFVVAVATGGVSMERATEWFSERMTPVSRRSSKRRSKRRTSKRAR